MAMFDSSNEDRTEPATQHRREEFRKQGKVAMSREVLSVVLLLATGTGAYFGGSFFFNNFSKLSHEFFEFDKFGDFTKPGMVKMSYSVTKSWLWMVFPVFAMTLLAGIVGSVAQVGFHVTSESMSPKWSRINPVNGMKRLFSSKGLLEVPKTLVKMGLATFLVYFFLEGMIPSVGVFLSKNTAELVPMTADTVAGLFYRLLAALAVLAIGDFAFQKWQLERQMRMTKREAKDEYKMREGDPLIKSRIRAIQRKIANQRMMENIPEADVVVTNPTHISVALQYDNENMAAPKVVAKGAGLVAMKIREIARFHSVPIVENKPLARALFKEIEIGHYIPRELFKAVAEVLAYVYRIRMAHQRHANA